MAYSHDEFNIKDIENYELNTKPNFDELLVKKTNDQLKVKPNNEKDYKEYFGEMDISEKQKTDRESMAEDIEEVMVIIFLLMKLMIEYYGEVDSSYVFNELSKRLKSAIQKYLNVDSLVAEYIYNFSMQIISATVPRINAKTHEELGASYWLSVERAINIAKNEANVFLNYADYTKAVKSGKTSKTWISMGDESVRLTHAEVDGETIPIAEYFTVGDSLMMFPHDAMHGASESELVGCRCSVWYQ